MNDHCNACEWQRITDPKLLASDPHSHTYCTIPRSSQCPVTNGSVLDLKDTDAVRQEQANARSYEESAVTGKVTIIVETTHMTTQELETYMHDTFHSLEIQLPKGMVNPLNGVYIVPADELPRRGN